MAKAFNASAFEGFDFATSSTFATGSTAGTSSKPANKSTAGQHKFYVDLCVKNGVTPMSLTELVSSNYADLSAKIDELLKFKPFVVPSEKQLNLITSICQRNDWEVMAKVPTFTSLTGGKDGTASEAIAWLFEEEKANRRNMPPSEKQITTILGMYTCPDVDFSELGWVDKFETVEGRRFIVKPSALELAEFIFNNSNIEAASDFISKFQTANYMWKQTRLNINQSTFIRQLENRMANIYSAGKEKTLATDEDGNTVVIGASSHEWSPQAYVPLNDLQINQLSVAQADEYIKQLQKELADTDLVKFAPEKQAAWDIKRVATGIDKLNTEYDEMRTLVYTLYAALGEDVTSEEEQMVTTVADSDSPNYEVHANSFKELVGRIMAEGVMTAENLLDSIKECRTASHIMGFDKMA